MLNHQFFLALQTLIAKSSPLEFNPTIIPSYTSTPGPINNYELIVSRPKVIFKEIDGVKCEPMELLVTFLSSSLNNRSRKCLEVINSPSFPAKGPLFTLKVIVTVGSSISTKGIFSGLFKSHIVSPMLISINRNNEKRRI